jgi:hypothetical protein
MTEGMEKVVEVISVVQDRFNELGWLRKGVGTILPDDRRRNRLSNQNERKKYARGTRAVNGRKAKSSLEEWAKEKHSALAKA